MDRGVKGTKNYDAILAAIEAKINYHNEFISKLELQRNAILAEQQNGDYRAVFELIRRKRLTADEVERIIESTIAKE